MSSAARRPISQAMWLGRTHCRFPQLCRQFVASGYSPVTAHHATLETCTRRFATGIVGDSSLSSLLHSQQDSGDVGRTTRRQKSAIARLSLSSARAVSTCVVSMCRHRRAVHIALVPSRHVGDA